MKLLVILKKTIFVFLVLTLPVVSAQAALIDNGVTTFDSSSGLVWLDLTETTGLTPSDILADVSGFMSSGWSVASGDQVDNLFQSAGAPSPASGTQFYLDSSIPDLLLQLLGQTATTITGGMFGQGWADNGAGVFSAPGYTSEPTSGFYFTEGSNNIFTPTPLPSVGVFLVQVGQNPIPGPNTLLCLVIGLVLLRRKTIQEHRMALP